MRIHQLERFYQMRHLTATRRQLGGNLFYGQPKLLRVSNKSADVILRHVDEVS